VVKAGGQCRGLAEVAAQFDDKNAAVDRGDFFKQLVCAVAGAVVDENQFKALADLLHDLFQARIEGSHVLFFIVERDDDREFRHTDIIDAERCKKRPKD
jgi:hypothetical protein